MSNKTFPKKLKCILSGEERRHYSQQVANLIQKEREAEDEKAAANANFNAAIKTIKSEYRDKAQKFRQGFEYRDVDCYVEKDFGRDVAATIRTDTGEVIAERPLNADERQRTIQELAEDIVEAADNGDDELTGLIGE